MVSEQQTRKMVRLFSEAGWRRMRTVGSHSMWQCPTGKHRFSLPDGHRTISPGVAGKALKVLDECQH